MNAVNLSLTGVAACLGMVWWAEHRRRPRLRGIALDFLALSCLLSLLMYAWR